VSDTVRLSLMESYVLPVLTYALGAVSLTSSMLREFSLCWNNIYRRIFGMNKWESVIVIQYFCGRLDFIRIYHLRKLQFIRRISAVDNHLVMMECLNFYMLSKELSDIMTLYAVDVRHCSCACIQDAVSDVFTGIVSGGS